MKSRAAKVTRDRLCTAKYDFVPQQKPRRSKTFKLEGNNVMLFAPVRFDERRACGVHHLFSHIEFHRAARHGSDDCLPWQKTCRCTHIRSDNERHAFCARTIFDDGRASVLRMLIDAKIAFCFINRPLPNSRRRLQMPDIHHPIASKAARRYHSARCMNVIEYVAANPNKRFERTADARRKSCDITRMAKRHRFPHSADGVVRRHAQAWRYAHLRSHLAI